MEDRFNRSRYINNITVSPEFTFEFPFEKQFNPKEQIAWMQTNWVTSIYFCVAYVLLVLIGKAWMAKRKPFKLTGLLFVWNLALATFSIMGAARALPELTYALRNFGFRYSVCDVSVMLNSRVIGLWAWWFVASKLVELGDTAFIVLRKQKLIVLHLWHHVTVTLYCFYSFPHVFGPARWFYAMNFSVHSIMYSYYALRSIGIRLPKAVAISITLLQIIQMIFGFLITIYAHLNIGNNCPDVYPHLTIYGLLMYSSYLLLFLRFFIKSYFRSSKGKIRKVERRMDENANLITEKKSK